MNPLYAKKDVRDRLAFKSLICFGGKTKWKKLASSLGMNIQLVESQMDEIIKMKMEIQHNESQKNDRSRVQDGNGQNNTDSIGEGEGITSENSGEARQSEGLPDGVIAVGSTNGSEQGA